MSEEESDDRLVDMAQVGILGRELSAQKRDEVEQPSPPQESCQELPVRCE